MKKNDLPISDEVLPELRANGVDRGLAVAKALLSVVPGGGFVAELLSSVLPEQRADRFARYLTTLAAALAELRSDLNTVDPRSLSGEQLALFEAGGSAAVRAPTPARVEQIAGVVANGMVGTDLEAARARRMLGVLSDLSDDDLVVLCSHVLPYKDDPEWRERHGEILWTHEYWESLKARRTPHDEMDRLSAAIDLQVFRLVSLGLLEEPTELDLSEVAARLTAHSGREELGLARYGAQRSTLRVEPGDIRISPLGVIVLQEVGLVPRQSRAASGKEWDAMEAARE